MVVNWLKCIFNSNKKYVRNKNYPLKNIGINKKGLICHDLLKQKKLLRTKMTYSESEPGFNFAIYSASDFHSASESGSEFESGFSSVFMNLDICIFYTIFTLF